MGRFGNEDVVNHVQLGLMGGDVALLTEVLEDLKDGDAVSLEIRTRRGSLYRCTCTVTNDGCAVAMVIKGIDRGVRGYTRAEAAGELLALTAYAGTRLGTVTVQRARLED